MNNNDIGEQQEHSEGSYNSNDSDTFYDDDWAVKKQTSFRGLPPDQEDENDTTTK